MLRFALLLAALVLATPAPAAPGATLSARPQADRALALAPGVTRLSGGSLAYLPARLAPGAPPPLLVLLHGAGDDAGRMLASFRADADTRGIVLLSLQARGQTWDLIASRSAASTPLLRSGGRARFGVDVKRIDAALAEFYSRMPVDPGRTALLGFSDGATYALSLGAANPRLFPTLIALSPGFVLLPGAVLPSQRIFIAHGEQDRVLSFATARDDIQGLLGRAGLPVTFRAFSGGHAIDSQAKGEALDFFLKAGSR